MKNKILILIGVIAAGLASYFFFGKNKKDEKLTANAPTPKTLAKPIYFNAPITKEEQKFIGLNGFEVASIIILKVSDPISVSGSKDMEIYVKRINSTLKTDQVGWTRNGEEVYKIKNPDGTFYYTIVPYVSEEETPRQD